MDEIRTVYFFTSIVTGCHRGPKRKLRAGVVCAAHFCKLFAGMWRPLVSVITGYYNTLLRCEEYFSSRFICAMLVSSSPLRYLCAKFRIFRSLRCWASPWRKIAYSITHSPSLFDAQRTEIFEITPTFDNDQCTVCYLRQAVSWLLKSIRHLSGYQLPPLI